MARSSYARYLGSPEWREKRLAVMKRSHGKCEFRCGRDAAHVHHVRYPKVLGTEPLEDLVAVCERCHETAHGIKRESMMKELIVREFHGEPVAYFIDNDTGEPWFSFHQTLLALGHGGELSKATSNRVRAEIWGFLDDDERRIVDMPGDDGELSRRYFVSESGTYHIAFKLDTPKSIPFRRWITKEVLPAIRRTGGYANESRKQVDGNPMEALELFFALGKDHDDRIVKLERTVNRDPDQPVLIIVACRELGHEPNLMAHGRQTLASRAGQILRQRGVQPGPKQWIRLEGSSIDTQVNTWRREDAYSAIAEALAE